MKRHRWTYPTDGRRPTREKPATCDCGAILFTTEEPRLRNDPVLRKYYGSTKTVWHFVKGGTEYGEGCKPGCTRGTK